MFAKNSQRNSLILCSLFIVFFPLFISSKTQEKTNRTAAEIYPYDPFISNIPLIKQIERKIKLTADTYYGTRTVLTQEDIDNLPSSFSWLDLGIMTSIKDQQTCGSCWAHSCLGVFEALIKKSDGDEVDLSEQQLVNCFADGYGCWGANSFDAMLYMVTDGIVREEVYPYLNDQWPCDLTEPSEFYLEAARFLPLESYESKQERRLKTKYLIMTYGPMDVFMLIYNDFWFNYRSGVYIYDGVSDLRTGHGVVIVGWVDDDSIPTGGYWIAKNSFGPSWGENGYFRIAYDSAEYDVIELDIVKYCIYNGKGNDPPYFREGDFKFNGIEGTEFSFTIGAFDPDGDQLVFSGENLPAGMYVDSLTGNFTWNPDYTQSGNHTMIATISDGVYTIRTAVELEITNKKKITGESLGQNLNCFIATAAYGSPLHPHVSVLREFRDKYLMPSQLGRKLVDFYYKYSPSLANLIAKNKILKTAVRIYLMPLVTFCYSIVHLGPGVTAIIFGLFFAIPALFIRSYKGKVKNPRLNQFDYDAEKEE